MNQITGIILAGGKSSRMGSDKAFLSYEGKKLIEHTIDLFKTNFQEIIISGNIETYSPFGFPVVADEIAGIGPMGGIYSTLKKAENDWAMVMACDTPLISKKLIKILMANMNGYECVIPVHNNRKEPLVALYHKICLPELQKNIHHKKYKMHFLLEKLNCCYVDVSDLLEENPQLFMNINSRADLT